MSDLDLMRVDLEQTLVDAGKLAGTAREVKYSEADAKHVVLVEAINADVMARHEEALKKERGKEQIIGGADDRWYAVLRMIPIPDPRLPGSRPDIDDNHPWMAVWHDDTAMLVEVYHDPADLRATDGSPLLPMTFWHPKDTDVGAKLTLVPEARDLYRAAAASFAQRMAGIVGTPVPRPRPAPFKR